MRGKIALGLWMLVVSVSSVAEEASSRIFGGERANPDNYPFFAKIIVEDNQEFFFYCGGAIVDEQWILTAGHCVYDSENNQIQPASKLRVVLGASPIPSDRYQDLVRVDEVVLHPNYFELVDGAAEFDFDFALLRLAEPDTEVSPADYPTLLDSSVYDSAIMVGEALRIIGFGRTETASSSDNLLRADIPMITRGECQAIWRPNDPITEQMFCTFSDTQDACNGDSGGPVLYGSPGNYQLVGVVSWGASSCRGAPGVYSDIGSVRDWVIETSDGSIVPESLTFNNDSGSGGSTGFGLLLLLGGVLLGRLRCRAAR
ncbi:S1 family peptidase [Aliagarivorans taiwanensis]|uniref:S1 family peptidase n=1 Tax=Aliagarivorans taiwanensis TaxID=561966 RepID=UPI000422726C|nr:serine protease [Aliagarivorans taiwanensis]